MMSAMMRMTLTTLPLARAGLLLLTFLALRLWLSYGPDECPAAV